jgi:hypothetical protein
MRILLVTDNPSDAIAFYRSTMPWNQLQKEYDDVIVTTKHVKDYFAWDVLSANDILFISNPRSSKHLEVIRTAKNFGLKVWSDYDDCYLDIPQDNISFNLITAGHVNHMTKDCLIESDIATVTTNYLKEFYLPYTTRIEVIPNGFPAEYLTENSLGPIVQGSHNFVSWRGSHSHKRNVREYANEITAVAKNNPDWVFKFFGLNPEFLEFNYNHHDYSELFDSFYRLKKFSSKVHIVTLYDRPFNKSKSNISWIEATIAGSVVLAPDWEEWQKPGIVNYSSKEDFKEKLQSLLNGEYDLTKHFEESRDYILNNLSLKKINRDRLKILQRLCVSQGDYRT